MTQPIQDQSTCAGTWIPPDRYVLASTGQVIASMHTTCVLPDGHDGDHQFPSGRTWRYGPDGEVYTSTSSGPLLTAAGVHGAISADWSEDQNRSDDVASVPETAAENIRRSDVDLLHALARHLRKHDVGCFADDDDEQERAEQLISGYAESLATGEYALILDVVAKARAWRAERPPLQRMRNAAHIGACAWEDAELARAVDALPFTPRHPLVGEEPIRRWRVGSHVGRTIYIQSGDESSKSDVLIGVMDTPELARIVVDAVNARGAS